MGAFHGMIVPGESCIGNHPSCTGQTRLPHAACHLVVVYDWAVKLVHVVRKWAEHSLGKLHSSCSSGSTMGVYVPCHPCMGHISPPCVCAAIL